MGKLTKFIKKHKIGVVIVIGIIILIIINMAPQREHLKTETNEPKETNEINEVNNIFNQLFN